MKFEFWAFLAGAIAALFTVLAARERLWRTALASSAALVLMMAGSMAFEVIHGPTQSGKKATDAPSATPTVDIRNAEYAKLTQLSSGQSLQRFKDLLGTPLFVTSSADGQFVQSLFRGTDYWVQAVSDQAGSVELMTITSCSSDFRPTFHGVPGAYPAFDTLVLQQTHLDKTGADPSRVHYFTSGATANSYYYDEYYFGNPGNYKTYYVGINDACGFDGSNPIYRSLSSLDYTDKEFDRSDPRISGFRAKAIANTYGESAPFAPSAALSAFQIGADRILTRTAPDPAAP